MASTASASHRASSSASGRLRMLTAAIFPIEGPSPVANVLATSPVSSSVPSTARSRSSDNQTSTPSAAARGEPLAPADRRPGLVTSAQPVPDRRPRKKPSRSAVLGTAGVKVSAGALAPQASLSGDRRMRSGGAQHRQEVRRFGGFRRGPGWESRPKEFHLRPLTGRVGDWRAGLGRSLCSPLTRSLVL